MSLRTKFQCIGSEGECFLEVRKRPELLETGMEANRDAAQYKG